jgi:hypothetical protein
MVTAHESTRWKALREESVEQNANPEPTTPPAPEVASYVAALPCASDQRRESLTEISAHLEFHAVTQHNGKLPV